MLSLSALQGYTTPALPGHMLLMRGRPPKNTTPRYRNNVRALRGERNWTQQQVADGSGLDIKVIGKIDRGEQPLNQIHVDKLARAFGVSVKEVLPDDAGPAPAELPLGDSLSAEIRRQARDLAVTLADCLKPGVVFDENSRRETISVVADRFEAALIAALKENHKR